MPISVSCACGANLKAPDAAAGRRVKCPKCGTPLVVPAPAASADFEMVDDEPAPAPVAARPVTAPPVAAARPRPAEDDDAPKSKRRRDEETHDQPRGKRRQDDDDAPKRKRRRDDEDDDRPKKKGALPLILGIVGGIMLVCGGGCAGVWYGMIEPAAKKRKEENDKLAAELERLGKGDQSPVGERGVSSINLNRVTSGMTLAQVEDVLGTGRKAAEFDATLTVGGLSDPAQHKIDWEMKAKAGHVQLWEKAPDRIVVAFSADPSGGGTVVAVAGTIGGRASEPVKLPASPNPAPNPPPAPGDRTPSATLSATELQRTSTAYKDKWVIVTGKVEVGIESTNQWKRLKLEQSGTPIRFNNQAAGMNPEPIQLNVGDEVQILGRVAGYSAALSGILVTECELVKGAPQADPIEVTAAALAAEFATDAVAATTKYKGATLRVSGVVNARGSDGDMLGLRGQEGVGVTKVIRIEGAMRRSAQPKAKGVMLSDTATLVGRFDRYKMDFKDNFTLLLKDCQVEK